MKVLFLLALDNLIPYDLANMSNKMSDRGSVCVCDKVKEYLNASLLYFNNSQGEI